MRTAFRWMREHLRWPIDHKVSVEYFLDMARNGKISTMWPSLPGGRAHLDGIIELAERVKARPSEDPFA